MKILIWGTGAIAKQLLTADVYDVIDVAIVAFVDNDTNKVGGQFCNKKIISPMEIENYSFDKICILNSYEEEIEKQIVNELQLESDIIVGLEDFNNIIAQILIENYSIQSKSILVIGDEEMYSAYKDIYEDLFHIVGFVEFQRLNEVNKYDFEYIMLMNPMNSLYLEREKGKTVLENQIKSELEQKYNITVLIFTEKMFQYIVNADRSVCWGDEHSDKTFLVIRNGNGAGLGAYVQVVQDGVHYALKKGYIPVVDMMTYPNQYLKSEEVGRINAWEKFFEQPFGYGMADIKKAKNVFITTYKPYEKRYGKDLFFLKEKPFLDKKVNEFMEMVLWDEKKVLGVLVRGTDYVKRCPYGHAVQPKIKFVIEKVWEAMKKWDSYDYIYVCTEVQEYIEIFQREFGKVVIFYPQKRVSSEYSQYLCEYKFDRENDEYYRGADYWVALKILSRCNALIGGECGGTQIARKLNDGKYEHIHIFDLGRYGIDDIG